MMKSPPPDIERARSALSRLSPDCNRDTWVRLAMALKNGFGDAGFEIWDEWSSSSEKYRVSDAKATWKSIKSDGKVTIATLFHEAKKAGWNDDTKYKKPTKAEIDARKAEAEAHAKLAEEEDRIRHRTSAVRAQGIWNEATPCDSHPYLESKGQVHGLRVGRWERVKRNRRGHHRLQQRAAGANCRPRSQPLEAAGDLPEQAVKRAHATGLPSWRREIGQLSTRSASTPA